MKVDRHVAEDKILVAINEILTNSKFNRITIDNVKKRLIEKNIINATQILNGNVPLMTVSDQILYSIAEAIYQETGLCIADPNIYFTPSEINIYKNFKLNIAQNRDSKTKFNDMTKINNNHYIGRIWVPHLVELYNNAQIEYNTDTQREPRYSKINDKEILIPKIYNDKVNEITDRLIRGIYEPDEITINLINDYETGEKADFSYINNTIIINSGKLNVIDGFNRSVAIINASRIKPLDIFFELRFTCFDINKAQDFIAQKNKQTKISKVYAQSLDQSEYHNSITKHLNEDIKSDLRGKIVTSQLLINKGYGLVMFDIMANAIKANFNIKTRSQSESIQEFLVEYFNELYNLFYNELEERKGIYAEPFSFIGYVAIASEIYQKSNWIDLMLDILAEIDFTTNNPLYQEMKRHFQTKISNYNIKKISQHFKKAAEKVVKNDYKQ